MKSDSGEPERQSNPAGRSVSRWIAGVAVARDYRLAWLPHDAMAGVSLSAVLVPAGMAYAEAAGLPVVSGLYASFAALLAYAVFGPSRILVLGPDSALVALIAASVIPLAHGNASHALALAGALALLSGAICVVVGVLKLGFATELLSVPIRYGYLNGIMLTIVIGQMPKLLGFQVHGESFLQEMRELASGIVSERVNEVAVAIGVWVLVVIVACRQWMPKVPGVLVAVSGATIAVAALGLADRFGPEVVGSVPQGLPAPRIPALALDEWVALLGSAAAIALVSFTDISVLSRTYELRSGAAVERKRVAHPGRGSRGREDTGDGCRRRADRRGAAAVRPTGAPKHTASRARGGRLRRLSRAARSSWREAVVSAETERVRAVDRLPDRGRVARCRQRDWHCARAGNSRIPVARMASILRRARADEGLSRYRAPPGGAAFPNSCCCAGTRRFSSQTRRFFANACSRQCARRLHDDLLESNVTLCFAELKGPVKAQR
jgi:hypothetical protein